MHGQTSCGMTMDEAQVILDSRRFEESVLITEYNKPVTLYAQLRSQNFAQRRGQQILWIQALDTPPADHFGDYTPAELEKLKRGWLEYHARKTEGVLSLFPCTHDLPCRITNGQGKDCREYKIYNGTTCRVKG